MKKSIHEKIILILGIYFFVLGIVAIINSIIHPEIANFLWFCYIALLLMGIGMTFRNSLFIVAQLNISIIPTLIWNIDFFYQLITQDPLFGITDYFFAEGFNSLGTFITLQHIYIIPLAIYAIYQLGLRSKKAWIISFIEIFIIFWMSLLFTSVERNANCVFRSCVDFIGVEGIIYRLLWFAFVFTSIFLVNSLLVRIFLKKNKY